MSSFALHSSVTGKDGRTKEGREGRKDRTEDAGEPVRVTTGPIDLAWPY